MKYTLVYIKSHHKVVDAPLLVCCLLLVVFHLYWNRWLIVLISFPVHSCITVWKNCSPLFSVLSTHDTTVITLYLL